MLRDPSGPVTMQAAPRLQTRTLCGYVLDTATAWRCGTPALYLFRLVDWPIERAGAVCAEHATVVRSWGGLEWMRSAHPKELVDRGRYTALAPASLRQTGVVR